MTPMPFAPRTPPWPARPAPMGAMGAMGANGLRGSRRSRKRLRIAGLAIWALAASAANGSAQPPDYPFCDIVREVQASQSGPLLGHLCIITPSNTDTPGSGMLDLDPNCSRDAGGQCIAGDGYGNHVVGIPLDMSAESRVALVISGAYGAPHSPILQEHLGIEPGEAEDFFDFGDVRYLATLRDAMAAGHLVLQVAYRNPGSVNRDFCDFGGDFDDVDPHPATNPHCHYLLRTLQLDGFQQCPLDAPGCDEIPAFDLSADGSLDLANAYFRRLDLLVDHLIPEPLPWPATLDPFDWSSLRMAGHSQGSGHAYLIATLREEVDRICYLAGPRDFDRVQGDYASWFRPYPQLTRTPKARMRALVSESDAAGAIGLAWLHILLLPEVRTLVVNDSPPLREFGNGHEEIIADPYYSYQRTQACFTDSLFPQLPPAVPTVPPWAGFALFAGVWSIAGGLARRPRKRALALRGAIALRTHTSG